TGDLFRRYRDGDHWIVDHLSGVIDSIGGPVTSHPIEEALESLDVVDLAVAYGLPGPAGEVVVAAVSARQGAEITGADLADAVRELPLRSRPVVVRVVDEIPVTTWYRPLKAPLRAEGIPADGTAFWWDGDAEVYGSLTAAAQADLGLSPS